MARRRTYRPINTEPRISGVVLWLLLGSCITLGSIYLWRSAHPGEFRLFSSSRPPSARTGLTPHVAPLHHREAADFPARALELSLPGTLTQAPPMDRFEPRPAETTFEIQVALVRAGMSPGSIDGVMGPQTRAAVRAFQVKMRLPVTGEPDLATRQRMVLETSPFTHYAVTHEDMGRLRELRDTWLGKSRQDRLDYESVLELVAEKGKCYPNYLRHLNPEIDWQTLQPGTWVKLPGAEYPPVTRPAAFVRIYLADRVLQAFDIDTNLLAHFPCSIAAHAAKRPLGRLEVAVVAENPNYTFNPVIFPESAEGRELGRKLVVPPGPNNPVGVAWIGLNRPGYGIHGTPEPEKVGRTESHGCFRLANWNAEHLMKMAWVTMPVYVEP